MFSQPIFNDAIEDVLGVGFETGPLFGIEAAQNLLRLGDRRLKKISDCMIGLEMGGNMVGRPVARLLQVGDEMGRRQGWRLFGRIWRRRIWRRRIWRFALFLPNLIPVKRPGMGRSLLGHLWIGQAALNAAT
jgi:hypothetical protein